MSLNNINNLHPSNIAKVIELNKLPSEDFEMISEAHYYSEEYLVSLVQTFMTRLLDSQDLEEDTMGKIMEVLCHNANFPKILIDYVLRERKNLFIKFSNYQNLKHFGNILSTISINIDNVLNENYDLNFAVVFIAERAFYKDIKTEDKIYLCAILSKNKFYSTRSFWLNLIELKLGRRVEEQLTQYESK